MENVVTILYIFLAIASIVVSVGIVQYCISLYRDRQWKINNPDEYEWFERHKKREVNYLSGKGKTKNGT
tara:strand:+ start:8378 stop:8584 length:207 start_codon:yes stop_codon:yes gene_type:complete